MTLQFEVRRLIEDRAASRPRSLQKAPGVSDLSGSCDHCLAAKIAGWPKRSETAWRAEVGTAIHEYLGPAFSPSEWRTELPVTIGRVGSWHVEGSADIVHLPTRTVVDIKTAGRTKLTGVRKGNIPPEYIRQVNLYAWGLGALQVALLFLPRDGELGEAVWWEQPVDLIDAERTLQRARQLAKGVDNYGDPWITDHLPRDPDCWDCPRYPDAPVAELVAPGTVLGGIMR